MKLIVSVAVALAMLTPCAAHAAACDTLKNATYAGTMRGQFDTYPDAFSGVTLTFDGSAVGHGRGVIGYDPASPTAAQGLYTSVTCASDPDGVSGVLNFGPSLGTNSFRVYDGGARIWTRHEVTGRNMGGWLFRLPAIPVATRR